MLALSVWKWLPGILLLLMVPTHLALWHSGAGPKIISDWRLSYGTWHWEACGKCVGSGGKTKFALYSAKC